MPDASNKAEQPNPHLDDAATGTENGVPAGAAEAESKGTPDSGRHQSETAANPGQEGGSSK